MTKNDLDAALRALHWRNIDLARRLQITPATVSRWRTGKSRVPGAVAAYLRLVLAAYCA